ncbi:MAG TPA: alpha/beta hydrolase-fold protein [Terriglobales bacterium]|nr:alpha/beta hydrolase-fold protein [Terriglobales bacterium]
MNKLLLVSLCTIVFPVLTMAQPPAALVSPEVESDGHVTFRFRAPNAQKVEIEIEGQTTPVPMQKDDQGVWTVTTDAMQPDIYGYSIVEDGVHLIDPSNQLVKPNLLDTESAVHIPGPGLTWELNQVPHGEIHHHFYHSKIADLDSDFYVYTPPDYNGNSKQEYPVLYLLHGFSDDASGWTAVGRANVIFDNLIAQGKMKPMIVVNPLGYGDYDVIRRGWSSWSDKELALRNLSKFTDVLLQEVMPQAEGMYRIKRNRESRAIAGLSMGGAESLRTGLNHLDQFAWIGAFSSGGIDLQDFASEFPGLDASTAKKLKLLWIACGTEDHLIKVNRDFKSYLKDKGVPFTDIETPGMHTWMVWRRNLSAFAPLLFR